jgi:hypothetical protein
VYQTPHLRIDIKRLTRPFDVAILIIIDCGVNIVCKNIRTLYNFDPPATGDEIRAAALQFLRKISGFTKPSAANEKVFNLAVDEVAKSISKLVNALVTTSSPRNREVEMVKARSRAVRRFGS